MWKELKDWQKNYNLPAIRKDRNEAKKKKEQKKIAEQAKKLGITEKKTESVAAFNNR